MEQSKRQSKDMQCRWPKNVKLDFMKAYSTKKAIYKSQKNPHKYHSFKGH